MDAAAPESAFHAAADREIRAPQSFVQETAPCGHCPDDDIQLIIHRVKLTHKPGSGTDSGRLFISLFPLSRIAVSHGSDIEVMLIIKLCIIDLIPFPAQLFPTGVMEGRPLLCT